MRRCVLHLVKRTGELTVGSSNLGRKWTPREASVRWPSLAVSVAESRNPLSGLAQAWKTLAADFDCRF